MKTTNIKTLAAALAAIISVSVLTSCSANTAQTNPEPSETTITTTTTSQTTPETTEKPQTTSAKETITPSSTKAETQTEKTTTPTSTAPATTVATSTTKSAMESTTKPSTNSAAPTSTTAPAPEWTESAVSGTMYVQVAGIYSRNKAVLGAPTVKQYNLNDAVSVTAVTNTGYYKLSDGSFIHADYLGADKVTVSTTKPSTSSAAPTVSKPAATTKAQSTTTKPASTTKQTTSTSTKQTTSKPAEQAQTQKPNSWREGETEEHYNAALKVAKKIADEVRAEVGKEKSLKQIALATDKVAEYYDKCSYDDTKVVNWSAWGVFIGKEASCAGATKALGMVLEQLGFEWEHMYEHSHGHQFCKVVNFSYNEETPSLKSEAYYEFYEDGSCVKTGGGELLETGMLKGNSPIYADADANIKGFTLGIGQGIGFDGRFGYNKDYKMITGFFDVLNDDGTLSKDDFVDWKHKDLKQYLT